MAGAVSKYIGKTRKNLQRAFDVAEEDGAILLFDEVDSSWGKRGTATDSHEGFANLEIGYLR